MSGGGPKLRVYCLSEDNGKDAFETVKLCVVAVFKHVKHHRTNELEYLPSDEAAQVALAGTAWKSKKPRDHHKVVDLKKFLAARLRSTDSVVIFHTDGDTPYQQHASSLNRAALALFIQDVLRFAAAPALPGRPSASADPNRIVAMHPHYSIESWLLQNTEVALELCKKHHEGRDCDRFTRWAEQRVELDEILKPKEATLLRAEHNAALARGLPVGAILASSKKSLFDFVEAVRANPIVAAALEAASS